jgi:unsaturated rhamnogalacturonyl hydrolase
MKYFFITLALLLSFNLSAQRSHPKPQQDMERLLRNVAENIIENSSFRIIDKKTGETFHDSKNLQVNPNYQVESPYNQWRYWNGVLNIGFITLGNQLEEDRFIEYAQKNVAFVFDHDDLFKKMYDEGLGSTGLEQKFRMGLLDDCGAMGAGVLAVHQIDPQDRYREYLNRAAEYIITKELRLDDGTFCRSGPYEMTVWGDDLYMSVPFLARMGKLTGESKYFDEAVNQVFLFNKHLWDQQTSLYFHCWYDDIKQNGVARWGRCNGWIIMAQIELLDQLPENHPKRDDLKQLLLQQIIGLSRYQDASGLWHQLIDKENTYFETSATAIFTYAVAKAINEGWIDSRYAFIATQGWEGVSSMILADGQVENICMGTGINTATYYYANRPAPLNDIHGLGAVLLAGAEVIKLYKNGIDFSRVYW